jgi:hypothetical protein
MRNVMSDELKSAYEIAMEKLRARDRDKGTPEEKAMTDEQKRRIAEIRTQAKAKMAELEILWSSQRAKLLYEPEAREKAEGQYVAERSRIEARAEAEIEKVRRGKTAKKKGR